MYPPTPPLELTITQPNSEGFIPRPNSHFTMCFCLLKNNVLRAIFIAGEFTKYRTQEKEEKETEEREK